MDMNPTGCGKPGGTSPIPGRQARAYLITYPDATVELVRTFKVTTDAPIAVCQKTQGEWWSVGIYDTLPTWADQDYYAHIVARRMG